MHKKPFEDVTSQKSQTLLNFIKEVKVPLLEIYKIAEEESLSQYKHLVRLLEAVILTPVGGKINFDFDKEKTSKTKELQVEPVISEWGQKVIIVELNRVRSLINKSQLEFKSKRAEKIFNVFKSLVSDFEAGDNLDFHKSKDVIIDVYNKSVGVPVERLYHLKPLREFGIPVVVQN